jgi:hypothetical protein
MKKIDVAALPERCGSRYPARPSMRPARDGPAAPSAII